MVRFIHSPRTCYHKKDNISEPTREELLTSIDNLEHLVTSLAFLHTRTKNIIDGCSRLPKEEQLFHIIGAMPRLQGHKPVVAVDKLAKRDIDWEKAGKALLSLTEMEEDTIWKRPDFPNYLKFSIEAEVYGLSKEEAHDLSMKVLWALLDDPHIVNHKIESEEIDYGDQKNETDDNAPSKTLPR